MTDFTHLAELSGLAEENFSDMEEVIRLISKITETDYPAYCAEPMHIGVFRDDIVEESCKKEEILKNSKTGFEIPKIM